MIDSDHVASFQGTLRLPRNQSFHGLPFLGATWSFPWPVPIMWFEMIPEVLRLHVHTSCEHRPVILIAFRRQWFVSLNFWIWIAATWEVYAATETARLANRVQLENIWLYGFIHGAVVESHGDLIFGTVRGHLGSSDLFLGPLRFRRNSRKGFTCIYIHNVTHTFLTERKAKSE